MASGRLLVHGVRAESVYGLADFAARFNLIVARAGTGGGLARPGSVGVTGTDAETFPGGGEPSAVKRVSCCASV